MKPQDLLAQDAWFRFVGDCRGGFSLLAVTLVVYEMLAGRALPYDIFELRPLVPSLVGTGPLVAGGLLQFWAAPGEASRTCTSRLNAAWVSRMP